VKNYVQNYIALKKGGIMKHYQVIQHLKYPLQSKWYSLVSVTPPPHLSRVGS